MEFTAMVEVTITVPEKEEILNALEEEHKFYPYTTLDEAWNTAYDCAYSSVDYELIWKLSATDTQVKISNYVDSIIYEFSKKHPEIADYIYRR